MKPANFPSRKAARQVSAANRRLSQEGGNKPIDKELEALKANVLLNVPALRDVRSKKRRAARGTFA